MFGIIQNTNLTTMNDLYAQLLDRSTSNIFFARGSEDPWLTSSISDANGNTQNLNTPSYLIEDAAHMKDLSAITDSDSASLKQARAMFEALVAKWIAGR